MTTDSNATLDAARGPKAIEASNNFHAFMRGWRHAASGRAKCPKHEGHATLSRPYSAGYSHTPSPFREAAQP